MNEYIHSTCIYGATTMCQASVQVCKNKHSSYLHGFYRLVGKADSQELAQINGKLIIKRDKCRNPYIIKGGFLWFNFVVVSQSEKHNPTNRSHFNIAQISAKVRRTRKDGEMLTPAGCRGIIIKCNVASWLGS